jgi:hypothetical protein
MKIYYRKKADRVFRFCSFFYLSFNKKNKRVLYINGKLVYKEPEIELVFVVLQV